MNDIDKAIIIAECNFIEELFYQIYVGKEEFTIVNKESLRKRLQTIRNVARGNEVRININSSK